MINGIAVSIEEYAEKFSKLSNEDLISEFSSEASAQDRCCGIEEDRDCQNALTALRNELLKRMNPIA